ncbi:hypothetical protein HU200_029310 [Digitaria exilis]|uniref:Uncharacterized protein n=1 Tax=Digitaria exilis TaxID=1010633 RepID=A0A835BTN5_9POAL|nr:hypothetical protein HU200_029310 [Digitaria exilis]
MKELQGFVEHLLLLRGGAPLDTCHLCLLDLEDDDDDMRRIRLWICHALMCKVRVLSLTTNFIGYPDTWTAAYMDGLPLMSQHLRRLELCRVHLRARFADFSRCPTLEVLKIKECDIYVAKILSQSLKFLSITDICVFRCSDRVHFYAPNLV